MPIWLRKFTYQQISNYKQGEAKELKKSSTSKDTTSANIGDQIPEHMKSVFKEAGRKASYSTKRAKK